MGKGIALQFKQAFPENYKAYRRACEESKLHPGRMFVFETGAMVGPKYIINFPTKRHWKGKSRMEDIEVGLDSLIEDVVRLGIKSIEGFETPYGMELLASVHWVGVHSDPPATNATAAVRSVHSWNDRKARMLQPSHIAIAWARLERFGCLSKNK